MRIKPRFTQGLKKWDVQKRVIESQIPYWETIATFNHFVTAEQFMNRSFYVAEMHV
jgi:hypothetical protein